MLLCWLIVCSFSLMSNIPVNRYIIFVYSSGSQLGVIFPLSVCLATSGDIFDCHNCGVTSDTYWVEAKDPAKHPITHKLFPTKNNCFAEHVNIAILFLFWRMFGLCHVYVNYKKSSLNIFYISFWDVCPHTSWINNLVWKC